MATQFYKGQKVRSDRFGMGVVYSVLDDASTQYPVSVHFGSDKGTATFTADGRHVSNQPIDLFPVDQPKPILTEWQRKRLKEYFFHIKHISIYKDDFSQIESILSTPEPPKWEPKQGEAVLVSNENYTIGWNAAVSTGNNKNGMYEAAMGSGTCFWNHCIPFDPALVGKVTD